MEKSFKVKLFFAIITYILFCYQNAFSQDVPTLEALIAAHKEYQKAEAASLKQIEINNVEQTTVSKLTGKVKDVQSVLHTKMSDANSYLLLGSTIMQTGLKMKRLVDEYSSFTTNTFHSIKKNPTVFAFYTSMNYKAAKEIKHLSKLIGMYAASGINILKASNDEKLKLIFMIQDSISSIRSFISYTEFQIRTMLFTGFTQYTINQILPEDVLYDLAQKQINSWNSQ